MVNNEGYGIEPFRASVSSPPHEEPAAWHWHQALKHLVCAVSAACAVEVTRAMIGC